MELDPQENPGDIKSWEVELDPQESSGEIKSKEVELDSHRFEQPFASVVAQQLFFGHSLCDVAPHSCRNRN